MIVNSVSADYDKKMSTNEIAIFFLFNERKLFFIFIPLSLIKQASLNKIYVAFFCTK